MDDYSLDIEKLRSDLKNDCLGAFFGGGFGGALIDSFDVDQATPEELIGLAHERGFDLSNYEMY